MFPPSRKQCDVIIQDHPQIKTDPLWALRGAYALDPRPEKVDLILGVYRDDQGVCPVMRAVRSAEERLVRRSASKEYRGLSGNLEFNKLLGDLVFGPELSERAVAVQSVAGTGALRILAELLSATGQNRTVLLGTPSYVNHEPIMRAAGMQVSTFPMLTPDGTLDLSPMFDAVRSAGRGDVLLIQGCCHNPTGLSLPDHAWEELAGVLNATGVIPFIDQAYYGLGDGLEADVRNMRRLLAAVPKAVVAVSGSKAFGMYSERVGCAYVYTDNPAEGTASRILLEGIARSSYSQPPSHGADVVAELLGSPSLNADWRRELESMRLRLTELRINLVSSILDYADTPALRALIDQRGMFLRLPLSVEKMEWLQQQRGVYGIPTGRINLAGLSSSQTRSTGQAIAEAYTSTAS
ncbi:aromatic amino acid transaminase [Arthrobacter sp. 31Y]|uniref:aromatic amino acid transaminase n=1 Tax=Arthrobacter sp. 31Y TaxID=1115632 RepID=UPI0027DA1961|nr:aromatic amino acid transaminase [Arthrobacter sp. 31Y]